MKKIFLVLAMALASATSIAQQLSKKDISQLSQSAFPTAVEQLVDFLSIPNNGMDPKQIAANKEAADTWLKEMGFSTKTMLSEGVPVLLAEKVSLAPNQLPTVLFYLQIDGQPVDPSKWEQENPYQAVFKSKQTNGSWQSSSLKEAIQDPEAYVFARSASDSKGPAVSLFTALNILKEQGTRLPFNIKLLLDFQEEMGSPSLAKAVENNKAALAADYLFIMDGARHLSNKPTLTFGARGIATAKLIVYGPKLPLHSGQYGNYAPNPVFETSRLLAGLKTADGKVTLPNFYSGIQISEKDQAFMAAIKEDATATNARLGIAKRDAIGSGYQEALQYPSLNIRGIQAGWVNEQVRTIIPDKVTVEIDMRLVPESDGKTLMEGLKSYIKNQGYFLTDGAPTDTERATHTKLASFSYRVGSKPFRTPMDGPIALHLSKAMQHVFGSNYMLMRTTGGSQPIAPFINTLGIPAVSIRIPNPDNNIHSPNENLRLQNFKEGIMTCLSILSTPIE
ncbi:MAG: M20/M25/M40 family metallo-hydrolase [Flavobacteriia bacterium]|nr:M20/M25/M40 family metallo-hydrolase [Flavobacteriia bacterium]